MVEGEKERKDVVNCLAAFNIDKLPEDTVDDNPDNADAAHALQLVIDSLCTDLPDILEKSVAAVQKLVSLEDDTERMGEESLWQLLCENDIKPRFLVALLDQISKVTGARSAIFSVFTLRNMMKVLEKQAGFFSDTRKSGKSSAGSKRKRDNANDGQAEKRRRAKRRDDDEDEDFDDDDEFAAADGSSREPDSAQEFKNLERSISQAAKFLQDFSLQMVQDSLMHCVDVSFNIFFHCERLRDAAQTLASAAISRTHGPAENGANMAFKSMLTWLLEPPSSSVSPSALNTLNRRVTQFVESIVQGLSGEEEPIPVLNSIMILCQQVTVRINDRAPVRVQASAVVSGLVQILSAFGGHAAIQALTTFLTKYSRNAKVHFRVFGVELVGDLLVKNADSTDDSKLIDSESERCSDKMPAVRAKSLSSLANVLDTMELSPNFWETAPGSNGSPPNRDQQDLEVSVLEVSVLHEDSSMAISSPSNLLNKSEFGSIVRRRCKDAKSVVRKAAVQEDIGALEERCRDSSVLVRKQALDALTNLVPMQADNLSMCRSWMQNCLCLVRDQEQTVQERAVSALADLLIQPIAASCISRPVPAYTWELVRQATKADKPMLQVACRVLVRRKPSGLPSGVLKKMMAHIREKAEATQAGLWWLVEEIAVHQPSGLDVPLLVETYENGSVEDGTAAIRTISKVAAHIPAQRASALSEKMLKRIKTFDNDPSMVRELVRAMTSLVSAASHALGNQRSVDHGEVWCAALLAKCAPVLESHVRARISGTNTSLNDSVEENNNTPTDGHTRKNGRPKGSLEGLIQRVYFVGEAAMVPGVTVTTRIKNSIQALLRPTNESFSPSKLGGEHNIELQLQGHVVAALGKLSLNDASLAKKCVSLCLRELELTSSAVLRNNVLVVLTDMCIRYTSLVDPHISKLALCLGDQNEIVRQHALVLITNLLVSLVDCSENIREQARQCLFKVLHPKSGHHICHTHLVEAIFVLNGCTLHSVYNKFETTHEERVRFTLAGKVNQAKRREIFALLLQHCTDEQRFQVTSKLCEDVLGAVADGALGLAESRDVLEDALALLASKEIKLSAVQRFASAAAGEDAGEEEAGAQQASTSAVNAVNAAAKSKLLSQIVKRNVMQNIVPTLAALKHVLEKAHSPLLGALMSSLAQIMKEYKSEIDDILLSNKQLAKELEFDMRQHSRVRSLLNESSSTPPGTGAVLSPMGRSPISIPRLSLSASKPNTNSRANGSKSTNKAKTSTMDHAPPRSGAAQVTPVSIHFEFDRENAGGNARSVSSLSVGGKGTPRSQGQGSAKGSRERRAAPRGSLGGAQESVSKDRRLSSGGKCRSRRS